MSVTWCIFFGAFVILQVTATRECDHLGVLVYDDMKCKPNFEGHNKCPSSYNCPDIKKSDDTCYYKGKSVKVGQPFNASSYCNIGCSCNPQDGGPQFTCAELDCANFGPPPPEGCYFASTLSRCCGGLYCPPRPVHKCTFEGKEYREKEKFFPAKSCSMCVCEKGFKGKIEEPFCIQRQCDSQIQNQNQIQKACAPVYTYEEDFENGIICCPRFFTCPDGNEVIQGTATSSKECRYGDKTLKVGQGFKKEAKEYFTTYKVSCKCTIPPLLTCVTEK